MVVIVSVGCQTGAAATSNKPALTVLSGEPFNLDSRVCYPALIRAIDGDIAGSGKAPGSGSALENNFPPLPLDRGAHRCYEFGCYERNPGAFPYSSRPGFRRPPQWLDRVW